MPNPHGSPQNLRPLGDGSRTPEEERAIRSRAAQKANETKRRKRDIRKLAETIMQSKPKLTDAQIREMHHMGLDPHDVDMWTLGLVGLFNAMASGDSRAAKVILELTGNDLQSRISQERMKLEKEKFKLTKEQFDYERNRREAAASNTGQLDMLVSGLRELRDEPDPGDDDE